MRSLLLCLTLSSCVTPAFAAPTPVAKVDPVTGAALVVAELPLTTLHGVPLVDVSVREDPTLGWVLEQRSDLPDRCELLVTPLAHRLGTLWLADDNKPSKSHTCSGRNCSYCVFEGGQGCFCERPGNDDGPAWCDHSTTIFEPNTP